MSDLRELYQQLIIDHGRSPRNFGELASATHKKDGYNPLCGDKVTVFVSVKDGKVDDIKFIGCGCAISMASASMMTQALKGKNFKDIECLFDKFHSVVTGETEDTAGLGKLEVLAGVKDYPSRVKCATLCWHTLMAALTGFDETISTE